MSNLKILTRTAKSLRNSSQLVTFPLNQQTKTEIKNLKIHFIASLPYIKTLGLAAPQIGVNKSFFISPLIYIQSQIMHPQMNRFFMRNFITYINPTILSQDNQQISDCQFCLSVPDSMYWVKRKKKIRVSYYNQIGVKIQQQLENLKARVFQHQYDHLQGILIDTKGILQNQPQKYVDLQKVKQFKHDFDQINL